MQHKPFHREPCFWTTTVPGYNTADRQKTVMRNGKAVTLKFPQRGHAGDYEDRQRAPGERFVWMIDHHGFESAIVLTNAAAHLNSNDGYGQHVRAKARHFGWYMPGQCPCALLTTGELTPDHIVSDEVRSGTPCPPGSYNYERRCKHSVMEHKARQAQNKAVQDEREALMKSAATRSVEATQALTEKLVESVTAALGDRVVQRGGKPDKGDR